jgi:hypothetical protein
MTTLTETHTDLRAADDSQRMLIWCVIRDAQEWHWDAHSDCAACYRAGTCIRHWDAHQRPRDLYDEIRDQLAGYQGSAQGIACALDSTARRLIGAALPLALAYRSSGEHGPEDDALALAYRHLAGSLGIADDVNAALAAEAALIAGGMKAERWERDRPYDSAVAAEYGILIP